MKAQLPLLCRTRRASNPLNEKSSLKKPNSFYEEKKGCGDWETPEKYHSTSANPTLPAVLRQDNINSPTALHVQNFKCFQTLSRPNVFTEIGCLLLARKEEGGKKRANGCTLTFWY